MGGGTFQKVYELTARIPPGRVTTYGQIAVYLGNPRLSRIVGCALHAAPEGLPCHRVVGRDGHLSDAFQPLGRDSHRMLLEMEGCPSGWTARWTWRNACGAGRTIADGLFCFLRGKDFSYSIKNIKFHRLLWTFQHSVGTIRMSLSKQSDQSDSQ